MGKKVTIDSSTMMNKGFEVIEAKWLFDVEPGQIEVVVHRKSLVHSMVQYKDGTIMANIGPKSMQIPIAYALNFPNRLANNIEKLDLFEVVDLKFVLVEAFLEGRIKYTDIPLGIERMMDMYEYRELKTVDEILEFDKEIKEKTKEFVEEM